MSAAPGDLDLTFGNGGSSIRMVDAIGSGGLPTAKGWAMVVQPDGWILVAGESQYGANGTSRDFAVTRYYPDGTGSDYDFGQWPTRGSVITDLNSGSNDIARDIALQSDGKILVTGLSEKSGTYDFALVRYLANGTLDPSFGTAGKVISDLSNGLDDSPVCLAVQGDGRIVVGGGSQTPEGNRFALARYNSDGALDTTFGSGGLVLTRVGIWNQYITDVAILGDGKILVAGSSDYAICLARYLPNGSLDPSFGIAGIAISHSGYSIQGPVAQMALQPDAKILVAGGFFNQANYDQQLSRFLPDGAIDTSFGSGGTAIVSLGGYEYGTGVMVRPDGRIVMCGTAGNDTITVAVFQSNGTLDPAFGGGSVSRAVIGTDPSTACVASHVEDKILVAGGANNGTLNGFAIARFEGMAQPEIAVEYPNGNALADGAATINFGDMVIGDYKAPIYLTIRNTGAATLYLSSRSDGPNNDDFQGSSFAGLVRPGSTTTVEMKFRPLGSGPRSAAIHITTNDADENPFDINLTGNALPGYNLTTLNPLPTATVGVPYSVTFSATGGIPPYQWSANQSPQPGLTFSNGVLSGTPTAAGTVLLGVRVFGAGSTNDDFGSYYLRVLAQTEPGALDVSFSADGAATAAIGAGHDRTGGMAIQSDGKIVVAGYSHNGKNYDAALLRFRANGTPDSGFGEAGQLVAPLGNANDYARATAIQANGTILVAGDAFNGSNSDIIVARCTSVGFLDTSYGTGGKTTVTFGAAAGEMARAIAIQPDGKAIVAGFTDSGTVHDKFALVRLTTTGALDSTFGTGGKVSTSITGNDDQAAAIALQPDGKIIAAGLTTLADGTTDFAIVRYLANGTLDSTFGSGGKVVVRTSFGDDGARGIAVQGDGRIVIVGRAQSGTSTDGNIALVRLMPDGSLDTSFGSYGIIASAPYMQNLQTGGDYLATSVVIDGAGRLLVGGATNAGGTYDFAVVRYLTNGDLDTTFGVKGIHTIPVGTGSDFGAALGLQPDGKIVIAGDTANGAAYDIAVVRLMGPSTPAIAVEMPAGYVLAGGATANCGNPAVGGAPVVSQITVRNAGGRTLSGLAIAKDGVNAGDFTVGALGATSLASGASTTFSITFQPAAAGTRTAAIHITSNDNDHNPFDLVLTGNGRVPPSIATPSPLPHGMVGMAYNLTFAATSGTAPYAWSVASGTAPAGLDLSAAGLLSGTPTTAGTTAFTVRATGADGLFSDLACDLTIIPAFAIGGADPTFGTAGKTTTAIGAGNESIQALAVQNDGRILAAGHAVVGSFEDFALARYLENGTLDPSFGTSGIVTTAVGLTRDYGRCIALQSDGKIVVAGESSNGSAYDFGIVRYLANGSLDTTFGTNGKATVSLATSNDYPRAVAIQSDGRIVVMGEASTDFGVIRLNPNGTLDTAFGTGGKVITNINDFDYALTGALQSDGRILVAGRGTGPGGTDFILARYLATGALDPSFDGDGKVTTAVGTGTTGDFCHSIIPLNDGKILAAGYSSDDCCVVRYNADGSLDTTFGTGGKAFVAISSFTDRCLGVALQSDGSIVLTGYAHNGQNNDFALARLTPSGAVDTGFGKLFIPIGAGNEQAFAVAVATGDRIILGGETHNGSNLDFALVRYIGALAPEIAVANNDAAMSDGLSAVGFGTAAIHGTGATQTFVITNTGTAPLTGIAVSCDGSHAADFAVTQPATTALAPGASIRFAVGYSPVAAGNRQAAIHISSNDGNESPFDITVSGTGGTPMQIWRMTYFGRSDNGGNAADLYDYDGDGAPNLLEYAFAGDPKAANPSILPLVPPLPGGQRAVTYRCDATRTDLTYTVQASSTLAPSSWVDIARSTGGATAVPLSGLSTVSDSGVGLRLVTVTPAASVFTTGKGFLRVKVEN